MIRMFKRSNLLEQGRFTDDSVGEIVGDMDYLLGRQVMEDHFHERLTQFGDGIGYNKMIWQFGMHCHR